MSVEGGQPPKPLNDAKEVLLRALGQIEEVEEEEGVEVKHLVVCWAVGSEGSMSRGWTVTDDPTFVITGLLREIANRMERRMLQQEQEDEEEDDDDGTA